MTARRDANARLRPLCGKIDSTLAFPASAFFAFSILSFFILHSPFCILHSPSPFLHAFPADFIRLPCAPTLTEGGIHYAVRSLSYTYDRMGGSVYSRLRRIVGGVAVELAFRRYLGQQGIPFDQKGATPFTEPDRYDVALGGHRCDVKTFIISRRKQIISLRRDPRQARCAPPP